MFFFKQKTGYELRISYWSSAVCSSDLPRLSLTGEAHLRARLDPGGQFEVDRRTVGERDALRRLRRGVDEGYRQAISDIGAFLRRRAAPSEAAERPAAAAPAAQPFENIAEIGTVVAEEIGRAHV